MPYAATSATDPHCGMLFERDPQEVIPCRVFIDWEGSWPLTESKPCRGQYLPFKTPYGMDKIKMTPLNQRGWVMQERLLSRRIIHFSQDKIHWQCCNIAACEAFPENGPAKFDGEFNLSPKKALHLSENMYTIRIV